MLSRWFSIGFSFRHSPEDLLSPEPWTERTPAFQMSGVYEANG